MQLFTNDKGIIVKNYSINSRFLSASEFKSKDFRLKIISRFSENLLILKIILKLLINTLWSDNILHKKQPIYFSLNWKKSQREKGRIKVSDLNAEINRTRPRLGGFLTCKFYPLFYLHLLEWSYKSSNFVLKRNRRSLI